MKKKILLLILTIFLIFAFTNPLKAEMNDSIESIKVTVNIKANGDADILEEWSVYNVTGTEWYKPISNLNHMDLINFKVNEDTGFEEVDEWKSLKSFSSKAKKYGIINTSDGMELCWGKTMKGNYNYRISYTYTDFITSFKDRKNGFLVKLVNDNMTPAPRRVIINIKLANGTELNANNSKVWMFGNDGQIGYNKSGSITAISENFKPEYSAIVMMELDSSLVTTSVELTKTFDELKEKALSGSSYEMKETTVGGVVKGLSKMIFDFFSNLVFIFMAIFLMFHYCRGSRYPKPKNFKDINFNEKPYNRDSILDKGLYNIAALGKIIFPKKIKGETIISAQVLKWINDGDLIIAGGKNSKDILFKIKEDNNDKLLKMVDKNAVKEGSGVITVSALGEALTRDIDKVQRYVDRDPISTGYIYKKRFSKYLTEEGKDLLRDIQGSYNFLKDFTLIKEKDIYDIKLWEEYLILATLFKMPKNVIRSLAEACPDFSSYESKMSGVDTESILRSIDYVGYSYKSEVYRSSSSFSSGSVSGGSGFSGGGSGGGSR